MGELKRTKEDIIKQIDALEKLNKANQALIDVLKSELKFYEDKKDD